jgi:hypothetical protein
MSKQIYALPRILRFVGQALKETDTFDYPVFLQSVWRQLEKANVLEVEIIPSDRIAIGQEFLYQKAPHELFEVTNEALYYLFRNGYIVHETPVGLNHPNLQRYRVTKRGQEWSDHCVEPYPEEADGYMKFLSKLVPNLDPVMKQYIEEALKAFERQANFAAAVMLGAASEKEIYLLADSMVAAIKDATKRKRLQSTILENRSLLKLFEHVKVTIEDASKAKILPYAQFESSVTHLMSMFEAIRVQRNEAVHPTNAIVSADSVRHLMQSFPYAIRKSEELRAWFYAHPNSI